tara:strand:+ start:12965 stop:13252 length:288 start_codon:yes stop_codon:yes gene_type:complete
MGRRSRNFKLSGNRKKKVDVKPKQKYDYSKVKGRIVGILPDGFPVIGSKSQLIKKLTNDDPAPFEIYDKKLEEFLEKELYKFKKYTNNELYNSLY